MHGPTASATSRLSVARSLGVVAFAGIALVVLLAAVAGQRGAARRAELRAEQRRAVPPPDIAGYVTSDRCQACHPDQYASWRATYHSTMTQLPSQATIVGDFDDHTTRISTGEHRFYRRGDEYWVRLPEWRVRELAVLLKTREPSRDQRVVLVTGSHHQQVYWLSIEGRLIAAGVNWVREFGRYAPLQEVFLKPIRPETHRGLQEWTANCVRCHSTPAWREFPARTAAGRPAKVLHPMGPLSLTERRPERSHQVPSVFPPTMPELAISCEACHGPAERHVETFGSPLGRYAAHLGVTDETHIVNPSELPADEAMELCGSCHAPRRRFEVGASEAQRLANGRTPDLAWPDGMIRSGGRGYLAVRSSPCYRGGEFSCLSCHSMHDGPPDDQLSSGMRGNQACLQCHADFAAKLEEHTHHEPESPGSLCYNCHMPHTAFNLLKATRSHQVASPDLAASRAAGRPNACNLCHLDRSLAWTADHLSEWYGKRAVTLSEEERTLSAAVVGVLKGDAVQRALYAWSMGWPAAQEASGRHWMAPLLAIQLDDAYPAVRAVASRSLRTQPGFDDFEVDPWRPRAFGGPARERALARWNQRTPADPLVGDLGNRVLMDDGRNPVLVSDRGHPDWQAIDALLAERDDRPVRISE